MKYYFCMALVMSALNGMDAPLDPMGSPPASPQFHFAPNSREIRYDRTQLLVMGEAVAKWPLSSSMDEAIKSVKVKTAADVLEERERANNNRRRHAKK